MRRPLDRRRFLQAASAAGVGLGLAPGIVRAQGGSANGRLRFACIGVGGRGSGDTDHVATLGSEAEKHPHARTYAGFRKLLEECGTGVDPKLAHKQE